MSAGGASLAGTIFGKVLYELDQGTYGDSGRALGDPGLVLFHPGGARNVEVKPRGFFGKFLQEFIP